MKKILVPCDFSETSIKAFKFALELAAKSSGVVELVHIIELPVLHDTVLMPTLSFEQAFMKDAKMNAEKGFEKLITKYADPGQKVNTSVSFGPVTLTICDLAQEKKTDLIVMGTKGASGLREMLIGSNTEKVVRRASVPVIAIKKGVRVSSIKNIVFPIIPELDIEELTLSVKRLQNILGANLHVVFINTPALFKRSAEVMPLLKRFAKRFMLKDYTLNIYNDINEEDGVRNFLTEVNGDMVAIATHGRKGIGHLISGSIAEDVVNHIECPIWTSKLH